MFYFDFFFKMNLHHVYEYSMNIGLYHRFTYQLKLKHCSFWLRGEFNFLLCHLDSLSGALIRAVFPSSGSEESHSSVWDPCHVQTLWALHPDSGCQTYTLPSLPRVWDALLWRQTGSLSLKNPRVSKSDALDCWTVIGCNSRTPQRI